MTPWAWDPTCELGKVGCLADGIHMQCRFCGEGDFDPCPSCAFEGEPLTPYVWDSRCHPSTYTKGCFADGVHFECRFCGEGDLDPCHTSTLTTTSTTWERYTANAEDEYLIPGHSDMQWGREEEQWGSESSAGFGSNDGSFGDSSSSAGLLPMWSLYALSAGLLLLNSQAS